MILPVDESSMARAVAALRAGACIGLPTETVYGLAGDGFNPQAVARIFEIKQRPTFDPLILHVPDAAGLERVAADVPPLALKLMARFWPGPLTLVLPRRPEVPDLVTSGMDTVAVRCPAHPVAQQVLRAFGGPLAAPSANPFGRLSPTTAEAVETELGNDLALVLDGGACIRGIESTIIDCTGTRPVLLRHGAIAQEEIEEVTGPLELATAGEAIKAPGLLAHHYAPRTPLWLVEGRLKDRGPFDRDSALLVWHEAPAHAGPVAVLTPHQEPAEAASRLFALLRELDGSGVRRIIAEAVPTAGLGRAIQDRLAKASAGRLVEREGVWVEEPR
ncbi:MAG: L-threonylcarbamoyladenylate synthase [Candidatus Methylacidiphilales bacterium]|nr:L-threonylcarbamoyladenylate synthase [Candidatus Methylacidiphilales bacterium]